MPNIRIKNQQQEEVTLNDIDSIEVQNASGSGTSTYVYPSGKLSITDTQEHNVRDVATAQVVDNNLVAGNIKKDVTMLGVTGILEAAKEEQSKTLTLGSAAPAAVMPDSGKVLSSVPVMVNIDIIKPENIKKDITILGETGTLEPAKTEQTKTLTLGAAAPTTVTPDSGQVLSSVDVSLDTSVIKAENIAKDVQMLGITGTRESAKVEQTKTLTLGSATPSTVTPDSGKVLSSVPVTLDTSVIKAANIKKNVTILGKTGTLEPAKTEQTKTLTLGAATPSTVTPDSGKVLSSVSVSLDTSVIKAANIAKNVTMLGITGTHEGGGGTLVTKTITANGTYNAADDNADGYSAVTVAVSGGSGGGDTNSGVIFIDYDGSTVETWSTNEVAGKTALPSNPSHTGLVAQGWNWDLTHIKDYIEDYPEAMVVVGQMYKTTSGKTEAYITVTPVTGLSIVFNMDGIKDWGDGSTPDELNTHTYSDYGDYVIKCDGDVIQAGTGSTGGLFGSTTSNMNRFQCTKILLGENISNIPNYAFQYCQSLTNITIPQGITSIGTYAFYYCRSLTNITVPQGVISIGARTFYQCYALTNITIPQGATSIDTYAFYECYSLTNITIPQGVTSIGTYAFDECYSLVNITIPQGVTSIGNYTFYKCYSLATIAIPQGVTSIGSNAFCQCYSLTNITIPQGVTIISSYAFQSCCSLTKYDFTAATSVPTLSNTNAFTDIIGICKIIVPDALYDTWIVATNWKTYANYIYKASEVTD